jgi:hypothetical protein
MRTPKQPIGNQSDRVFHESASHVLQLPITSVDAFIGFAILFYGKASAAAQNKKKSKIHVMSSSNNENKNGGQMFGSLIIRQYQIPMGRCHSAMFKSGAYLSSGEKQSGYKG